MASKNFVVKHGITVGGVEVIDATGQVTSQALVSAVIPGPTKTSDLTNDSGFITSSDLSGYAPLGAIPTQTSQLINSAGFITSSALSGYALSSAIPTKTSDLTNDSGFITSSALSGYALTSAIPSLTGYALTSAIPTKTSDITNDSGFITSSALSGYAPLGAIPTQTSQLINSAGFITASALSGYALSSAIPTNTNQLTNGAGFITASALSGYALSSAIPSLTGYATQTYVNTAVSNLVNAAPTTLDTLNEIATALGNDANFSSTITALIGTKASTSSLAAVATSGNYDDLINKPNPGGSYTSSATAPSGPNNGDRWFNSSTGIEYTYLSDSNSSQWVETTAASLYNLDYNSLNNKPTIPVFPSQTGNSGKVLSTDGSTLSWVTAPTGGGGGGSVDLSHVSQDITPGVTGTYSVGTDLAVWGSVNSKYVKVNAVETNIGTVVGKNTASSTETVTFPSFYTSPVVVAGINWPGFYYLNVLNVSTDIFFDEPSQTWIATSATGTIGFAFYSPVDVSGVFPNFIGQTIQIVNEQSITLTVQVTNVVVYGTSSVDISFTTSDGPTATILGKAFNVYVDSFDNFAPSIIGTYTKYTTTITVSNPVVEFPTSAYPSENGEPFYYTGLADNTIVVPGFESCGLNVYPMPFWADTPLQWSLSAQTNNFATPFVDNKALSKMAEGDTVYFEYFNAATTITEHAVFKISQAPGFTNWGNGIWSFGLSLTLIDADNKQFLDPTFNAYDYFVYSVSPSKQVFKIDTAIDVSGLYIGQSLFDYAIDQQTYDFFNVGSTIGYYGSPKIRLQGGHPKLGGINIGYDIKTKQTVIDGFVPTVTTYKDHYGPGKAIVSFNSSLPDINADITNGVALGNNAGLGAYSVSIGDNANSSHSSAAVSIGPNSYAAANSVSVGSGTSASGYSSVALGSNSNANHNGSVAIGYYAVSQGDYATAIGASQAFIASSLAYGGTNYSNYRNQSVAFQLHGHSPTATSYLSQTGANYTTQSYNAGIPAYNLFAQGGGGVGLIYGTATFMIPTEGTISPVSAFIWKIVEIKFSLYAHKWVTNSSSSLYYNATGNYEFTTISTTTIASSAAAGHAAWTPSLQFGYSVEGTSNGVYLWAKVAKTDSLAITATAKFEIEVLNATPY